jgi:hypothetical protein
MKWNPVVISESLERRISPVVCFGGALIVLPCSVIALERYCDNPGQFLTGVMATFATCIGMILLGVSAGQEKT